MNKEQKVDKEMVNKDKLRKDLRVLAIDDNPVCLKLVETVLKQCHYKVTTTTKATTALELLRENKNSFDIVITDVRRMNDMDGFKLLEIIGFEMDIPVIMMSSEDDINTVRKGIEYGACDYLVKPVRLAEIQNIWQHVVRRIVVKSDLNVENGAIDRNTMQKKRNSVQMNDDENKTNSDENYSGQKKPRFSWNRELQLKFIAAHDKLGPDKAVPSKLLTEMSDVPGLTREIIASHLQKYRDTLKKNRSQNSNISISSNGMCGQLSDATVSSIPKQGQSGVNCFNGIKPNVYGSSPFQYGHLIQNRDPLSHSFVNPKPHFYELNQQVISSRQYSPNIVNENCQRMQVRGLIDLPPNSMTGSNSQSYPMTGSNSQFFSSQSRPCNPHMEMPSKVTDYYASRESRSSNYQFLGCTSDSLPIHSSIDFSGMLDDAVSNELSRAVQNDSGITAVQNSLPGHNVEMERDIVRTTMGSSNREHSTRIDQTPLEGHHFEHLETDSIYQLSSCSSNDDDFTAAIKREITSAENNVPCLDSPQDSAITRCASSH